MAKEIFLKGKVAGDGLRLKVTVPKIPAGQTVVKAWMSIKNKATDSDVAAIVLKVLTSGFVHTGTDPVTCTFTIDYTAAETGLCKPKVTYDYDIKVLTSAGIPDTPIIGQIVFQQGSTRAIA